MGSNRYESVALALAASDAYENADENLEVIDATIGDMRSQVSLDEDAFAELVSRFRLVLDTNRTAPAVMRIMCRPRPPARLPTRRAIRRTDGSRDDTGARKPSAPTGSS